MLFWLICAVTALVVASLLLLPLLRPPAQVSGRAADVAVYRDQLAALDAEIARGVIAPEEAETTRIELSRRLLAADAAARAEAGDAPPAADRIAVLGTLATVIVGGTALYLTLGSPDQPDAPLAPRIAEAEALREATTRPPQEVVEAMVASQAPPAEISEADTALLEQLADLVAARPTDLEGRRLLARSYMQLGRYLEGRQVQTELVTLAGEAVTAEDLSALAEYMIVAAGGYVSPQSEAILMRTLDLSPDDPWARYYLARGRAQTGDTAGARAMLEDLLALPDVPSDLAGAARADLSALRGPDAGQIADAADMAPEDRQAMIEGMVAGLADRLATEGGPPEDWARLIRALDVLGDTARADAILAEARAIFADAPAALATIEAAR